jgi:hypothetical protein
MPEDGTIDVTEMRRRIAFMWNALERFDRGIERLDRRASVLLIFETLLLALPVYMLAEAISAGGRWGGSPIWSVSVGGGLLLVALIAVACLLLLRAIKPSRCNLCSQDPPGILEFDPRRYDRRDFLEATWGLDASHQWAEVESATLLARELLRRKSLACRFALALIAAQFVLIFVVALAVVLSA